MAFQRTDFISSASRALTEHADRSGLRLRTPILEGLEKFRRRFEDSFQAIERLPDSEAVYQSMLPIVGKHAKITTADGDSVHLLVSKLFRYSEKGRLGVMLYLLREESVRLFLMYQSQSHCMWRVAPSGTQGWFGKTDDQNQLNVPWSFQRLLDRHALDSKTNPDLIHPSFFEYLILQPALYRFYDEMCHTVLLGVHIADNMGSPSPGSAIDVRRGIASEVLEWPTQGRIKRVSFDSLDSALKYHFVVSPYGFGMSSAEERVDFNKYGLRPMPAFVRSMIEPFTDYYQEIDFAFAPVNSHYALRDPVRVLADLTQKIDGVRIVPKKVIDFLNGLRQELMGQDRDEKVSARWEEAIRLHS